jgi:uncharacterized FAD-dependent dehydrogenase
MKIVSSLRVPLDGDADLKALAADYLGMNPGDVSEIRVIKKSLDARGRRKYWNYSLEVYARGESPELAIEPFPKLKWDGDPPLIIGAGPAGLFAAWTFLQHGIRPILLERGERMHERMRKISRYWRTGVLDPDSNVCHGEGGAGTFSDGKLITRIKSPHIPRVMRALVDYGAPEDITYVYNPHVGSNLIRGVIKNLCDDLRARGAEIRFGTRVEKLLLKGRETRGVILSDGSEIRGSGVVLACGHSAGAFFEALHAQDVFIEPKSFALGVRIEHPQAYVNQWQLGSSTAPEEIRAAQYKLATYWDEEKIGVYTFCMCPGGYVVSSTTDPGTIVVNGMSNYHRNSPFANAAVVVSVDKERIHGEDPFKMMRFQRGIETQTYRTSALLGDPKRVPVQRLEDFLLGRMGRPAVKSSCPSGTVTADFSGIFPDWVNRYLRDGLLDFERRRRGFLHPEAVLHAVESRTSSPVRITRDDETLQSVNTPGLFPCGEGAGYAGGITSAAVDGMRAALEWIGKFARA